MKSQGTNCELFLTVGGGAPHSPLFAQCAFAGAARKNRAVHKVGGPVPDSVRSVYDLDADLLAGALGNGLDDRADLFGNAALPADEFSHILGRNTKFKHSRLAFYLSDRNAVGIVNQTFCHIQQKILHASTPDLQDVCLLEKTADSIAGLCTVLDLSLIHI